MVRLPAKLSVAEAVRKIKGGSSKWIHEEWNDRSSFGWQRGYGAFGVSQSHVEGVERYIDRQKEHHRRFDFETEFLALLQKHGIEFDPADLWK